MTTLSPTVQKHMRRVLIVFAVFVAVNVIGLAWFFMYSKPAKLSPLFPYVSAQAEQTVLVKSDSLLELIGDDVSTVSNNPLYSTLDQSNYIGLLQFGSGIVNQYSAILIDAKK